MYDKSTSMLTEWTPAKGHPTADSSTSVLISLILEQQLGGIPCMTNWLPCWLNGPQRRGILPRQFSLRADFIDPWIAACGHPMYDRLTSMLTEWTPALAWGHPMYDRSTSMLTEWTPAHWVRGSPTYDIVSLCLVSCRPFQVPFKVLCVGQHVCSFTSQSSVVIARDFSCGIHLLAEHLYWCVSILCPDNQETVATVWYSKFLCVFLLLL